MTENRMLYDELCRVLTDYEGNGAPEGASASDLYALLVKIQNRWDDGIAICGDSEDFGIFGDWLMAGTGAFERKASGYHNTLIKVRKNADFDYFYVQRQYHSTGIKRGDMFEYAGVYCKRDGLVYDSQYGIRDLYDEPDTQEARSAEALHKQLKANVRSTVEAAIGNDRNNLRIAELTSERALGKLDNYKKYYAIEAARKAYLGTGNDGDIGGDSGFVFTFGCDYRPEQWSEDSLLAYILDPDGYVRAESEKYIDSHQEEMLSEFLESDMVAAAYAEIIGNPSNPIHRVKRIIRAVSASSAKTVTVTIRKDDVEFTFKTDAREFRSDCTSYYSEWNIIASDRKEFERLFGRSAHYVPEDILRIEYARSVLYEGEVFLFYD